MKTINHYEVEILKNGEKTFKREKIEVIAENEGWIVLNTRNYDRVTKTKTFEFCHCRLDKPRLTARENDKIFKNGVFYEFYSYGTKRATTIRKEIAKFIDDRYGYLAAIDLSFIKL